MSSSADLPQYPEAYQSLCLRGEQIPTSSRHMQVVEGLTYQHPRRGILPVKLDNYALRGVKQLYTNSPTLITACAQRAIPTQGLGSVIPLIAKAHLSDQIVWGFSGYATAGYPYDIEAEGMRTLFTFLNHTRQLPSLVIDGGVSDGVLGLGGVLADSFAVPTLGYIPFQGLDSLGPRTYLVVHKNTYAEREILVGLTSDALACVGGGPGTQHECEIMLGNGGVVLLLALRDYREDSLPNTYMNNPITSKAAKDGRLVVCKNARDIPDCLARIIRVANEISMSSRNRRVELLRQELA